MNRILAIAARHWILLAVLNGVVAVGALYALLTTPKVWTARSELILPNTSSSSLNADLGTLGSTEGGGVVFSQQVSPLKILSSILLSEDTLRIAWEEDPEQDKYPRISTYAGLFTATPQIQSTVISLNVEGSNPEVAQQRAELLISAFQKRLNSLRIDDATQRSQFLQRELDRANQNLQEASRELRVFQETSGLVNSEEQTRELVGSINELVTSQADIQSQAIASSVELRRLSERLGLTPEQAYRSLSLQENSDYQFARQKLAELEAALVTAQATYTNEHPRIQELLDQRGQLVQQLNAYVGQAAQNVAGINPTLGQDSAALIRQMILTESRGVALQQQANQLQKQIDRLEGNLKGLPSAQARLKELQRQYDISQGVYNGLMAKAQEARLNAFSIYPSVQVLAQPTVDTKPTGPNRKLIVLGAFLASAFGSAALLLFLESRNPRLNPKGLQQLDIPVVGSVGRLRYPLFVQNTEMEPSPDFQRLGSAVSMMSLSNRRLMITSAVSGEGKTTVTLGLAHALTTLGFRVLLVDGDFRKAELSNRLGYAAPDLPEVGFVAPINVRPRLDLAIARPNPARIVEFVAQGQFEQFLNAAQTANDYDYVLIDSSPIEMTSEALLAARLVGTVLMVIYPGVTRRDSFYDSVEQLKRHRAEIAGFVVNGMETRTEGYAYRQPRMVVDLPTS